MKQRISNFFKVFRLIIVLPGVQWKNEKMLMDIRRWKDILGIKGGRISTLAQLMNDYPEFRNLFIFRCGRPFYSRLVKLFYPPMKTLYLDTPEIGGGLFIQHGFATMIAATSIGENCWINQQVTIGYNGHGRPPIIGNNVFVFCGAKILGSITVGDNAIIGANACVIRDVEPKAVMGGVPAKKLK